jgi:hypothetical protein
MATDYKFRITAQDKTKGAFNSVNKSVNGTQKAMKKLAGAFAGAFAVRQLVQFGNEALQVADSIGKVADSIGVSTKFLQQYQFAAQQAGLTTEEFNKGMQNFTKMVGQAQLRTTEAGRTLEKLGVQVKNADGTVKNAEEVFVDLFHALDNVGSQFEKNAILADLMGRAGVKLAVMGKDGAEAMQDLAASTSGVFDEETVRRAEAFNDAMNRLKRQVLEPLQTAFINTANAILSFAEAIGLIKPDLFTKSMDELNTSLDVQNALIEKYEKNIKRFGDIPEFTRPLETAKEEKARLEEFIGKKQKQLDLQKKINQTITDTPVQPLEKVNAIVKENITIVKSFADTVEGQLTNAFTDFFDLTTEKFGDFKELATSVARAVINELIQVFIVQKLVGMVKGSISDFQSGIEYNKLTDGDTLFDFDGGGFTGAGVRAGGLDGKGGFMAMVHPNETVVDHTKGQSVGGGATVNFNISTVDAAGFDQLLTSRKGLITSIINNAMNTQGKMGVV